MLAVLAITAPIFALVALGFACVRLGVFSRDDMPLLGRFAINVSLPALIVAALSRRGAAEILRFDYLAACAAGSLAVYALVFAFCRGPRRRSLQESAVMAMGVAISNTAFMGFPIVFQVVGGTASVTLALNLLMENVLMLPFALALADLGGMGGRRGGVFSRLGAIFLSLARKPLIIAIFVGLALSLLGKPLPEPVLRGLDMLGAVAPPVALFTIGGNLGGGSAAARQAEKRRGAGPELGLIVGVKLILHPLVVGLIVCALPGLAPEMRAAAIVFASMPVFSIYPLLGVAYGMERFCSAAVVVATLLSFVSVSTVIWVVRQVVLG